MRETERERLATERDRDTASLGELETAAEILDSLETERLRPADIRIEDHGSIYLFIGQTENGIQFLSHDVETEPWQWLANGLCVDHHNAAPLAEAILENGLSIGETENHNHHN